MPERHLSIRGLEEFARVPRVVVAQTDMVLSFFRAGGLYNPDLARQYLGEYTMSFLDRAKRGAGKVFERRRLTGTQPTETLDENEAADVANVIFALMHKHQSPNLPTGFSRRGMLRAPQNETEFQQRIEEIERELGLLVGGIRDPKLVIAGQPSVLRTHAFFQVGSEIPIKFGDDGSVQREMKEEARRKQIEAERAKFELFLTDVTIEDIDTE